MFDFIFSKIHISPSLYVTVKLVKWIFIVFVLFFERKESRRRVLWLLSLYFMPVLGIVLYILFSGHIFTATRRMTRITITADQLSAPIREKQIRSLESKKLKAKHSVLNQNMQLVDMNLREGNSLLSYADSEEIYCYGKEFFEKLCFELENAKETINMEYFIFRADKIGTKIMDILCRKAREGVDVKLMYDDFGCIQTSPFFYKKLNSAGGLSKPFFQVRLGMPLTLNYRNHRKLTVIDSRIAFIGGMNIGDEYANDNPHRKLNWRDTSVRLTGTCVLDLQVQFLADWYSQDAWTNRAKKIQAMLKYFPQSFRDIVLSERPSYDDDDLVVNVVKSHRIPTQIVTNDPHHNKKANIEDAFIRMILSAKKRVYIETPYFTPSEEFYTALKIASYSGVDVRIIIPGFWDKFYMKAASSDFARQMCDDGVSMYLYPGFIHSKMITVDGKVSSIGTTNIDNRSFSLHFEQNVIFYDERFSTRCEKIIERDLKSSMKVDRDYYDNKTAFYRAFCSFCRLFAPLM